jgi:uncharacterized protein YkwD
MSPQEQQLGELIGQDSGQRRSAFNCNAILAQVARARAEDMATRGYVDHTNPDGYAANYFVRQAGYALPSWWPSANNANFIESIAPGRANAQAAFSALVGDVAHRNHILAENQLYANQTNYGVGYAVGGPYGNVWVVLTAPPPP